MSYRVEWTAPAQRDLARLPPRVATAIMVYVDERLAENPLRLSKPLTGDLAGMRSARNGDYRVLIRLAESQRVVSIVRIDHRAHAYRRH